MDPTANQKKRPQFVTEVVPEPNQPVENPNSPFAAPQATHAGGPTNVDRQAAPQATQTTVTEPQPQQDFSTPLEMTNNTVEKPAAPVEVTPTPRAKNKFKFRPSPKNFIFVIPAIILVATIAIVAYFTRTDYVVREPGALPDRPTTLPIPTVQPTTAPKISYLTFSNDQYTFKYPDKFFLSECEDGSVQIFDKSENQDNALETACGPELSIISLEKINQIPSYLDNEELVATESATLSGNEYTKYEIKASGSNTVYLPFTIEDQNYQFVLRDILYRTDFLELIASFNVLINITEDWNTHEDLLGYSIKYPSDWTVIAPTDDSKSEDTSETTIRRDKAETKFQSLSILASQNVEDASINASQAVSSTKSLAGWDEPPITELRNLGGANAQIIRGSFNGTWNVYAIIWYRDNIIQMTWEDSLERSYDQVLEQMLNSLTIN